MNTTQLENELLRYTKGLSKDALREVIDFVQFLRQKRLKSASNSLTKDLSLMSAEQTLHLEEEFQDYKKLYPSE
ncbi:MAG: hypothetical protein JJT77_11660 [Crocinitomicaceae bacterium]|jgi:hypothetical protein|nr:hypothetical protein [Crocinitomicaceae bacterium]